jgi:hypothetical protein
MIKEIRSKSVRPTYTYKSTAEDIAAGNNGWNHTKVTLSDLFQNHGSNDGLLMAWPTERIRVEVEAATLPHILENSSAVDKDTIGPEDGTANCTDTAQADEAALRFFGLFDRNDSEEIENEDNESESSEHGVPRTRQKIDRFHVFDSFPASRDPDIKPALCLIRRLVIQASIEFDSDGWRGMTELLASKHAITNIEDILDNFHFNREYWYRRVRVYPPRATKGLANVVLIKDLVLKSPSLKIAWCPKLEDYFNKLEQLFHDGKLEECCDVELYQWDGVDKDGLDVWLRRRGSNRSELLHQKMKVAFGPHGVGATVGHFLLLLVTYIFNVNTGVRRKRFHNFGMPYHDLIDRIQIRHLQIFGVDVFPRHNNQALFKPVEGFVAVGIGPLNYHPEFVESGPPHASLKGDMRFLAERMELVGPPLHIAHPYEKHIFNEFMKDNPSTPNSKTWRALAANYKEKTDYKTVSPKLPSMLQNHFKNWKASQDLVTAKEAVKGPFYDLLAQFSVPASSSVTNSRAAVFQKETSDKDKEDNAVGGRDCLDQSQAERAMASAPTNPMPVAPLVAPQQTDYVPVGDGDGRGNDARLCCAAFLGCRKLAVDCARMNWQSCQQVQNKTLPTVDGETANRLRTEYNQKKNRDRMAKQRNK